MQEMLETRVWSLSWEDPLEEGMAIHSSILACEIPWTKEPGGLWSIASHRAGHDWSNLAHVHVLYNRILFIHSIYNSLYWLVPSSQSNTLPPHLLLGKPVLYVCESVSALQIKAFNLDEAYFISFFIYGWCFSFQVKE